MSLGKFGKNTSFLLITLDSCRWDVYRDANTPGIDSYCHLRKAYSQGTYTFPSHQSIFSGILPSTIEREEYYNRFSKSLFRISARKIANSAFLNFPGNEKNIIQGFNNLEYFTVGTGAMMWFKNESLTASFKEFLFSGINISQQSDYIIESIKNNCGPYFIFMNVGETHEPYSYGGKIEETYKVRNLMREGIDVGFLENEYLDQIKAVEYLDGKISSLIKALEILVDDLVVVICSDHGECFGEDGMYGHGFYHEKVMEVPLGIFRLRN